MPDTYTDIISRRVLLCDAIVKIHRITGASIRDIIDANCGVAWTEQEGDKLEALLRRNHKTIRKPKQTTKNLHAAQQNQYTALKAYFDYTAAKHGIY